MLNRNWQCQTMKLVYSIRLPQSIFDVLVNVRNTRVAWASFLFDNSHRLIFSTASLGPLHMSPVDRAGSVSEISPRRSFLYKNFDVFIWEGDLGFCDRDLGNRAGNFSNSSHMNTPARISGRNIFNCAWLVRSLTGRNAVPRVFWWPFGHFSSR